MAGQRLPHFSTSGWYFAGTAPLANAKAPPPPEPASPAAAEYVPTTSNATKDMATPTPMPPTTQNFRTPQPSPIGAPFMGGFDGVCESSGSPGVPGRHFRRTEPPDRRTKRPARRTGCTGCAGPGARRTEWPTE